MLNKEFFAVKMVELFESKTKQYTDVTLDIWYKNLKHLTDLDFSRGIDELIKSPDDFVSVGKLLDSITDDEAYDAWEMALTSARAGGRQPITKRVARALNQLGGMIVLRSTSNDRLPFLQRDFVKFFHDIPVDSNGTDVKCIGMEAEIMPDRVEFIQKPKELE